MLFLYFKKIKTSKAFTLVELLVVISIISLLSSIVLAALTEVRSQARYSRAESEIKLISHAMQYARQETGGTIRESPLSLDYVMGSCQGRDLRNIPDTDPCYTSWVSALEKVKTYSSGVYDTIIQLDRDPWGSPYLFDGNECYRLDLLESAGPNGIRGGSGSIITEIPASGFCP